MSSNEFSNQDKTMTLDLIIPLIINPLRDFRVWRGATAARFFQGLVGFHSNFQCRSARKLDK